MMTILALAAYFVMGYFVGRRVSRPQPLQQAERQVIRRAVDAIRAVEEKRKWCGDGVMISFTTEMRFNDGPTLYVAVCTHPLKGEFPTYETASC